MKSATMNLIFITILIATVAAKGTFKVHSHSGSWCDYETGLGKVNIQVIQEGQTKNKVSFNMTLVDDGENKYSAQCSIDPEKFIPEPQEWDKENESDKSDINVDIDIEEKESIDVDVEKEEKESIDVDVEKEEKESIDVDVDVEKEEKESIDVDVDVEKEEKESIDVDVDVEKEEKESIDVDVDVEKEEKESIDVDVDVEKEEKESIDVDVDVDAEEEVVEEKEFADVEAEVEVDVEEKEESENKEVVEDKKDSDGRRRLSKKKNLKAKKVKLVKKRKLEEKYISGVCYFDPPKESYNLRYEEGSLVLAPETKDEVVIEDDFYVIAQKCLSYEEAENQLKKYISFRQLNKFEQIGDVITFYFYGLTTEKLEIGFTIEFYVYLILENEEKEKEERKITCTLEEPADPQSELNPVQADFKCVIDGLKEKYSSLIFIRSDSIVGVPTDEIYLNPYLTYLEIQKGTILDFSLPQNKVKVPTMFATESIVDSDCESQGTFKITGKIGAEFTEMKEVRIPLTFPTGVNVICNLPPAEAEAKVEMECKFGGELDKQSLIIEQRIVRDGNEELFTFKGAKSEPLTCINGELKAAEKKLDIKLSFRQVNKFEQNGEKITFSFFGLSTQKLEIGHMIDIWLYLLLPNGKREKTQRKAECKLLESIAPIKGEQVQADFSCEITGLDPSISYSSFEISNSDDFSGLPDNKVLIDPEKTKKAIENGELDDFSLSENKIKVPLLFESTRISETTCLSNGQFSITGNVKEEIEKDLEFIVPLSYPENLESKCTLEKSTKTEVEMLCVLGGEISEQSLIFEQQVVRNGLKEVLTLGSIKSDAFSCAKGDITIGNGTSIEDVTTSKTSSDRPQGDKPLTDKTSTDKSHGDKDSSDKSHGGKDGDKDSTDKSHDGKDSSDKSHGGKDDEKDLSDKSHGGKDDEKDSSDKSHGGIDSSDKSHGGKDDEKDSSDKSHGDKDSSDKSHDGKDDEKDSSDKSHGGKDDEKDSSDKSHGGKDSSDKSHDGKDDEKDSSDKSHDGKDDEKDSSDKSHDGKDDEKDSSDKSHDGKESEDKSGNSTSTSSDNSSSGEESGEPSKPSTGDDESKDDDSNLTDEEVIKKDDEEALEEAEGKLKISLSFRQLNKYSQQDDTITFFFYGLTTQKLEKDFNFPIYVKLILMSGEREEEEREAKCVLQEEASPEDGQSVQADFKCTISSLTEQYYSLRLIRCDYISGIPTDEMLLDPVLTAQAIARGELLDYSLEENKGSDKIPALFTSESINSDKCKTDGTISIQGSLSKELENDLKFKVPLSYPSGVELTCSLAKGEKEISCKLDREVEDKVMLEQIVIKDGLLEVLILGKVSSDGNVQCSNAVLLESEEKAKVKISFRQVSHFEKNGRNGFNFFLATFVSQSLVVNYQITIKIIVVIKGVKTEKEATCKLQSAVNPGESTSTQGDFLCEGKVEEEEYKEINFEDSQSVTVSSESEELAGVSDLTDGQDSPIETDAGIKETNEAKEANETISELAEVVDYHEEENKEKLPPSLEITRIEDVDECRKKSKIKIFGKFSEDISEDLKFELPLTFPSSKIKCKVSEAKKDEEVELECKVLKEFTKVKNFVFEQRMIKKRKKEVVLIKSYSYALESEKKCVNYNKLRLEKAQKRQKLNFSFLQVRNFKPVNNLINFFMAIILKAKVQVTTTIKITIKVRVKITTSSRALEEGVESLLLPINCALGDSTDSVAGLNCAADTATEQEPLGMLIDPDETENIAGVPENADPDLATNELDFSNKENMAKLDNMPTVTISSINGDDCSKEGSYVIEGTYDKGDLKDASNIEIPFSTVDSSGQCELKVGDDKKITLNCENKEQFDVSTVGFERMSIKDTDGQLLFILESYTNPQQFGCAISLKSEPPKNSTTEEDNKGNNSGNNNGESGSNNGESGSNNGESGSNNGESGNNGENENNGESSYNKASRKESSGGLSGGAIAAIIICAIIVLAIIGVLIGLAKSGKIFGSKPPVQNLNTSSSLNNFAYNPKPNEF